MLKRQNKKRAVEICEHSVDAIYHVGYSFLCVSRAYEKSKIHEQIQHALSNKFIVQSFF